MVYFNKIQMIYSDFTIFDLRRKFGIKDTKKELFGIIEPVSASKWLQHALILQQKLPINSEKAKSEFIIAPILTDIWEQSGERFSIHSGINLDADTEQGLNGECDFILSADAEKSYFLKSPIFTIVEAKRDDFLGGVPQCAAQMLGATYFNNLDGKELDAIYGCVTDGTEWLFLKLENKMLMIDDKTYFTKDLEILLGVFKIIINESL
jgi:hypothetical protein